MSNMFCNQFQMTRRTRHQLRCAVCSLLFPSMSTGAMYCSNACKQYAFQQRRKQAPALAIQTKINTITDQPSPLSAFSFESRQVRVITDEHGDPWFVATDVCSVLGIGNPRQATTRLDADEKGVISTDTPGGVQAVATVNEPGLYTLVLGSRKPEAKRFKRWVTHEVLPAIRRTGSYAITGSTPALPYGIHVVATSPRHAHWLWLSAVEEQVSAAIGGQIGAHRDREPSAYQLHLSA